MFPLRRRHLLAGAGALAATTMSPFGLPRARAQGAPLKVGTYGGYFKDSFDEHIFPDFTEETGIEVESVAEPTGEAWLVQLETAARAGAGAGRRLDDGPGRRGSRARTPSCGRRSTRRSCRTLKNLQPHFVHRYPDGQVERRRRGVVVHHAGHQHRRRIPEPPTSWKALWDPANKDRLGLLALASNSFLLEITAKTFFGGTEMLDTEDGILKALDKLAELKPNVRLWYRDEAQFEQALKSGEIPMGQYYHDVTGLAAAEGKPVRSTFPEGRRHARLRLLVRVARPRPKLEEAHVFINYMCQPEIQAMLSRKVGTAPTVKRELLDLTAEEFAAVSSRHRADHSALRPLSDQGRLARTRSGPS